MKWPSYNSVRAFSLGTCAGVLLFHFARDIGWVWALAFALNFVALTVAITKEQR